MPGEHGTCARHTKENQAQTYQTYILTGLQAPTRTASPTIGLGKLKLESKLVDALSQAPGPHPGFRDPGARSGLWKSMGAKGVLCVQHTDKISPK